VASRVTLETEEQKLQREQNERDVLEALGEHNRMSVENVPVKRKRVLLTSLQSGISQKRMDGLKN
jgi:hypothetical protein